MYQEPRKRDPEHIEDLDQMVGHILAKGHEELDTLKAELSYWGGPLTEYKHWDEGLVETCQAYGLQPDGKVPQKASKRAQLAALYANREEHIQSIKQSIQRTEFNIQRSKRVQEILCERLPVEEKIHG